LNSHLFAFQWQFVSHILFVVFLIFACIVEDIEFTKLESRVTFEAGSSALIACSATGKPQPQMSWRFNSHKITFGKSAVMNNFKYKVTQKLLSETHEKQSQCAN